MSLPYKKVLLVGATSGIGAALADKLVENGTFVIAAGRRKENLDKFVDKHGADKAAAAVVDILRLESIPEFAASTLKAHPEIDCVFLNAGVQRGVNFTKAETVDLDIIHDELLVNYLSHVHLTKAFLPHLSKQGKQTALLYTTSQLGLTPMKRCPNYSGSKAAMHGFILALRAQLRDASSGVRVVEVYPPAVQTELHDAKNQPDLKNGHAIGMPVGEFVDEVYRRWIDGEEQIPVGTAKPMFDAFENARQEYFVSFNAEMDRVLVDFTA
ncbi:Putative short-chain dehydrogenase/reductase SDR, NAD(P)-binding domain superfamily [Colletotrichum destructivum]|uniref:Short-chain dehydrogenase/reductase SDR, NAD(P)-binding domain superfamily n=1 Tax=Colletotrichum destructivum TaxID=34406 RepID=A0AAX4IE23_9PEZI|nr:Putative short-chain dehydrogenase/reductase SDR, NAD(P)-binding domain superfamily [Colletotrichum destructivum]